LKHLACRTDALADLAAQAARRKKRRRLWVERQIVHLVTHLAADLEHIAESLRCDQSDAGAFALKHRVGRNRRTVHEASDLLRWQTPFRLHLLDCLEHPDPLVLAAA